MGPRTDHDGADRGAAGISRRAVCALAVFVLSTFAAGALAFGLGAARSEQAVAGTRDGCQERELRFTVTNDQREVDRQLAFESKLLGAGAELPPAEFHAAPVDQTASLHAASHNYVVVYHRDDIAAGDLGELRELHALARSQLIMMLVAPRAQEPALVAVRAGMELSCAAARADQVARVRAFAAELYRSLAAS